MYNISEHMNVIRTLNALSYSPFSLPFFSFLVGSGLFCLPCPDSGSVYSLSDPVGADSLTCSEG